MKSIRCRGWIVALCAAVAGCTAVKLIAGADQVRVTHSAGDLAGCTSLGKVEVSQPMYTDPDSQRQLQNDTVRMGGDALLLTSAYGRDGVAYRCGPPLATAAPAAAPVPAPPPPAVPPPASTLAGGAPPVTPGEIVQAQVDAYNRHDLEGFLSFYTDDARIAVYPDQPTLVGKQAIRERYRKGFEDSPQLHASILARLVFDRFVIDQVKLTGERDGQMLELVSIHEVRDGRIAAVTFLRH